jgi:hypothetical protein
MLDWLAPELLAFAVVALALSILRALTSSSKRSGHGR